MTIPRFGLGDRAAPVFDRLLGGDPEMLHPDDRRQAEEFWAWLGGFETPHLAEEAEPASRRWPRIGMAVAAGFALLLAVAAYWLQPPQSVDGISYATAHSERRSLRLPDGSAVSLGAESQVVVRFTRDERRIRLVAGEALFDVAHNPRRPLIVETPQGEVRALGTSFDVRLSRDGARVTVVEGIVRISLASGAGTDRRISRTARAGEQVRFGIGRELATEIGFIEEAMRVDPAQATAWTRGVLHFRGEPLDEVIAVVNRYSREKVVLTDRSLARMPVYAVLHEGDTAALVELIENPDGIAVAGRTR
jgi:transmembrane sensor